MKKILLSIIAAVLALSMSSCLLPVNPGITSGTSNESKLVSTVGELLEDYSYYDFELTDEQKAKGVVAAYREATGDKYAYYYTAEEFEALTADNIGETQGIGITIIENVEHKCIEIISVLPNSPALKAGVEAGDLIVAVGIGDKAESVSELGYEMAIKKLQGVAGTMCDFAVVRNGNFDEVIEFSVLREKFTSQSVMYAISKADSSVGIVKILEFNLTTPTQFSEAMESLIAEGCNKFVYDLRNNPGGDLNSVSAVLSRFYNEGDIIIRTRYRGDSEEEMEARYCEAVNYGGDYKGCSIKKEDIGKYRNYPAAIIVNDGTASAAELFTSGMKDYGLATVVGETTYGKGCMQSIISLESFKLPGAMKVTTAFYYPPISDNYHDVGISPDSGYEVKLSDDASKVNIYSLLDSNQELDNQLDAALLALKNK